MFQRRILGLVSYYIGATPYEYAKKIIHRIEIPMNDYFEGVYNYLEAIEKKKEQNLRKKAKGKIGDDISIYSAYTRQGCNFIFPNLSESINGEKRPRPSNYNIKESEANIIEEGKNLELKKMLIKKKTEILEYLKVIRIFVNTFISHVKNMHRNDIKNNYTISDDIKEFVNNFNYDIDKFLKSKKKSDVFNILYKCSPKFTYMILNIFKTKGTVLIYSNYVEMEGLQLIKVYLNFTGFVGIDLDEDFNKNDLTDEKHNKDFFRFCEFHGGITKDVRRINKDIFNNSKNKYGKYCKIIMISTAGAEGINLSNVRQVHIVEPYWNEVKIEQVIGRALRYCQHKDLPMNERLVDVYRYIMIRNNRRITTDEYIENLARKKNNLLSTFIEAVKEASIDCELFKNHNMLNGKYKCFQFNENSLFEDPTGPAYNIKIENDQKMNNGINSIDSSIQKIKVIKIKAVTRLDNNVYSIEEDYWLYFNNGIVYDYKLNYPIGKIFKDDNGNFEMLDNNIYIIGELIKIPLFKIYD
jgi:hypothetical protein